jgi:DNA replication protein DnaC
MGVGKLTEERHSMYYYIIDYRLSNGLKTIITSNFLTKDLWRGGHDVSPDRIITRIREGSIGVELKK